MCRKLNCWEFKMCGREPGGVFAEALGVCPVAKALKFDGINEGKAGGRTCWMLRGSLVDESLVCADPGVTCADCAFHRRVIHEESDPVESKRVTPDTQPILG
ncbi:MAG: hypothetical protein JSU65_06325 [Candidatus Zixiibacteriota bacterium]|nr:MAG: hypothetical protein JSU65_06325 [candidate division Zixibacteria bacterium]